MKKKLEITHKPLDEVAAHPRVAFQQMGGIFRNYGQTEPRYARWRAHMAMTLAAAKVKDEPMLWVKAAALAAGLELNPNDRTQPFTPIPRSVWVSQHLMAAYLLPVKANCWTPNDYYWRDMQDIETLADATGTGQIKFLLRGINAKHFGTGEDPIAARISSMKGAAHAPAPVRPAAEPHVTVSARNRRLLDAAAKGQG